jgi:hypothetical protein
MMSDEAQVSIPATIGSSLFSTMSYDCTLNMAHCRVQASAGANGSHHAPDDIDTGAVLPPGDVSAWAKIDEHHTANKEGPVTNNIPALSKWIPKPCYKQYTGIFKIDTEMTYCRQYTSVLKIDTEMKCFKQYRGVLKIDTEIASVLFIRVHSSRDRQCCIYRYKYISGRDQVEVSKARSKSTPANNLCFRYSGGRSSSNASPEKQYKTRVGEPKALRPPDLEVARTPAHLLDVLSTLTR